MILKYSIILYIEVVVSYGCVRVQELFYFLLRVRFEGFLIIANEIEIVFMKLLVFLIDLSNYN
jgi:hypothetical protein